MEYQYHILNKMVRIIDTSPVEQKEIVARYISLANRRLNSIFSTTPDYGIIGASMAVKNRFEDKFGAFIPISKTISLDFNKGNLDE